MKQNNTIAIQLTGISKKYTLHHEKPTLIEGLINDANKTFWALQNINLTIKKGEKVGIIGRNGSGKTTLLKIIAGITSPTQGKLSIRGNIVSLIGLDAGFHPDLSGLDNIYLCGALLGMKRIDIQTHLADIIRFADIGEFIDVPIHTYSAGMKLRLGFAIGLYANPNTLILDESMDIGDQQFKNKIRRESKRLFRNKTLIVVSHNMYAIADLCDRIVVMEQNTITYDGGLESIIRYDKTIEKELRMYLAFKHKKINPTHISNIK